MPQTKYCDFHFHLGGGTPVNALWEMAYQSGKRLNFRNAEEFRVALTSPAHDHAAFLNQETGQHSMVEAIQHGPDAVRKSCYAALSHAFWSCNGELQHLELRFDPSKRGQDWLTPLVKAARQGLSEAGDCYGVSTKLIVCADRRSPTETIMQLAHAAVNGQADGFDICGTETGQERDQDWIARTMLLPMTYAWERGLFLTYHVGEVRGTSHSVANVLDVIEGVTRIGHGLSALRDLDLMSERELNLVRRATFEVCPTACLVTGVTTEKDLLKCLAFAQQYKVKATINSDNPVILGTSVKAEHELVAEVVNRLAPERWQAIKAHLSESRLTIL